MNHLAAEFFGTALMIVFGVGVHSDVVLNGTKYHGSGHLFAITTWAFGITVALYVFGGVCINPAMTVAQAILGRLPWNQVVPYCVAELAGGFCGAVLMYFYYSDYFKASVGKIDPVVIRNIFSTSPGIRNLPRNFFSEFLRPLFLSPPFLQFPDCTTRRPNPSQWVCSYGPSAWRWVAPPHLR